MLAVRLVGGRMIAAIADSRGRQREYEVTPADRDQAMWAANVTEMDAAHGYRVALWPGGSWTCDCPDARHRGRRCKHQESALEVAAFMGVTMAKTQIEEREKKAKEAEVPAVYRAIARVQSALAKDGIAKDRTGHNFKFRGIDDVYNALAPLLAEHGLCILPRMLSRQCTERATQKGGALFYVVVEAEYDFVAVEDASRHTVRVVGEAMDSGDKATNKAMSAAYKYACFQAFCIPTEGDHDADAQTHEVQATHHPAAVPNPAALGPPKETLWQRLLKREAAMVEQGQCKSGELREFVLRGLESSLGRDPRVWDGMASAAALIKAEIDAFARQAQEIAAVNGAA